MYIVKLEEILMLQGSRHISANKLREIMGRNKSEELLRNIVEKGDLS